jgi:hypothetical protein
LALALGKTVQELMTGVPGMDGREFAGWKEFDRQFGPIGPVRGDLQAGVIADAVYWSGGMKRRTKLEGYVLRRRGKPEVPLRRKLEAWAAVHNMRLAALGVKANGG